jgi:hypothetical protein
VRRLEADVAEARHVLGAHAAGSGEGDAHVLRRVA